MTLTHDPDAPGGVATTSPRGDAGTQNARRRKAEAALAMIRDGEDWDIVASTLGYPDGDTARAWTERALADGLLTEESQEFLRAMMGRKLEALLAAVEPDALNPDHPEQLARHAAARATIRDHMELMGYKSPTQFVVNNPSASRLAAWVALVEAKDKAEIPEDDPFDIVDMEEGPDGVFETSKNAPGDD